ncbi:hypothetical protein, partial [Escherichia coli]|uniref:hypothetical protein n=1 Tax=Escherichia coli TaxID=562 RepID=UPI001BAEA5BB
MLSLLLPSTIRLIATRNGQLKKNNVFRLLRPGSLFSFSAFVQHAEGLQRHQSLRTREQKKKKKQKKKK